MLLPRRATHFFKKPRLRCGEEKEYILITNLGLLYAVPLLHSCSLEDPQSCSFVTGNVNVTEERTVVQQRKTVYNCLGRQGQIFLVNAAAFSVPTGIGRTRVLLVKLTHDQRVGKICPPAC